MFSPKGQTTTVVAIPAGGGSEAVITDKQWFYATDVRWLNHARGVVVVGEEEAFSPTQVWYVPYPKGRAERITNDLNYYSGLSFTADSTAMVTANIWVTDGLAKTEGVQITSGDAKLDGLFGVSWSPDGKIVYASRATGDWQIWITDADGRHARSIPEGGIEPRISPDGQHIVFSTDRDSHEPHVWRMDLNGDHAVRLTDGESPGNDRRAQETIRHFCRRASLQQLLLLAAASATRSGCFRPQTGTIEKRFAIHNGDPTDVHSPWRPMAWRSDSKAFYFLRETGGASNIWEQTLEDANRRKSAISSGIVSSPSHFRATACAWRYREVACPAM